MEGIGNIPQAKMMLTRMSLQCIIVLVDPKEDEDDGGSDRRTIAIIVWCVPLGDARIYID